MSWEPRDRTGEMFRYTKNGVVCYDYKKIRGAMLKFVREVDRIEAATDGVTGPGFMAVFDEYMTQEFDESWADHREHTLDDPVMWRVVEGLYGSNEEFRELADDVWVGGE